MNARTATVAVTGIGGFVGRHVALALLREGYPVHGTVRALGRVEEIERSIRAAGGTDAARLTFGEADLLEERGWAEAFAEVSYVVHTASPFPARLPANEDDLIGPARDGTLRVLRAAHAAGAKRVVLTSSVAAVIYGAGRAPFTEDDWTDPQSSLATPYYRSKTFAERAAWDCAADSGLELVVINPGMVLGPVLGHEIGTSVAVVRNLLKGNYPALPKFAVPVVDVRDVADAHVQALSVAAAAGERFLIAGEALPLRISRPSSGAGSLNMRAGFRGSRCPIGWQGLPPPSMRACASSCANSGMTPAFPTKRRAVFSHGSRALPKRPSWPRRTA